MRRVGVGAAPDEHLVQVLAHVRDGRQLLGLRDGRFLARLDDIVENVPAAAGLGSWSRGRLSGTGGGCGDERSRGLLLESLQSCQRWRRAVEIGLVLTAEEGNE